MELLFLIAVVRGFFMLIAPMPLWKIPIQDIWGGIGTKTTDIWINYEQLFRKGTAWLVILSLPWLLAVFLTFIAATPDYGL